MRIEQLSYGEVRTLSVKTDYIADSLGAFYALTDQGKKKNSLLLDSLEIESKKATKSILMLNAAVRIESTGNQVTLKALNANGLNVLSTLSKVDEYTSDFSGDTLKIAFIPVSKDISEQQRLKAQHPIDVLRLIRESIQSVDGHEFAVFLAGNFAYDFIESFESMPEVASENCDCPNYVFYLAETLVVIEHNTYQTKILTNIFGGENYEQNYFEQSRQLANLAEFDLDTLKLDEPLQNAYDMQAQVDIDDARFADIVRELKQAIIDGDVFQIVPSRTFSLPCYRPFSSYYQLRALNPSPYMFFMNDESFQLFGASPESAIKYAADSRTIEVYPIAGTRHRGFDATGAIDFDLDGKIEVDLRTDEKEVTEHLMLVDLARNDIARISETGTRQVVDLLKVDRYSHVMHLVSRVIGKLKSELDALHAYLACMNMGTLVGAPKIKAAQMLRKIEGKRRGAYGGAVGYLSHSGHFDSCIVIRSALVRDNVAYIKAGAGVVYDSDPDSEVQETINKAKAVKTAILRAHGGSSHE